MNYFLTLLLSWVLLYKYAALFFIIFSAAILIPWPENSLLLATGAFASQGYFNIALCFAIGLGANVLGDCVGYFLTWKWGTRVIKEHHIQKYSYVARLNQYVKEHAGATILITRFIGSIGPLVNYLSGLIGVPFGRFITFDIIGNALDIGFFLVAGYIVGSIWQNFSAITSTIGWIVLVIFVINILVRILWKKRT